MSTAPAAKWAALIADRLFPMPRRSLRARQILDIVGATSDQALVRDHNSPNDRVFADDDNVELGDGNVFYFLSKCDITARPHCGDPAKRAWVVDDNWEIGISDLITMAGLRALLDINHDIEILRDFESPFDELLGDHDHVRFKDGPVFVTRQKKPNEVTIIVEGSPHLWSKCSISYVEVVTLFDPNYPQHPEITYSVTYKRGPNHKPEGILSPGASTKVKEGMVFNVSSTGQS
jgi:hypothetical protein